MENIQKKSVKLIHYFIFNSSSRLGSRNSIQEITSNGSATLSSLAKPSPSAATTTTPTKSNSSSIIPRKMPKFLSSIRAILRAIGVGIISLIWRKNSKKSEKREDLNKNNDSEEDEEDNLSISRKNDLDDKDMVNKMPNNSQHQFHEKTRNNKNGGNGNGKNNNKKIQQQQQRKKSLTDLDEASSTTTESSTLDDLNDSKSSLDLQNSSAQ